ncbi:hypothetical protein B5807_11703 [Epicoccum nigrum]|uniref:Carrier domain-containing protein n=1 Tax=Epicoccum nigrum TaxID=105696 RepID=A0A1Y2LIL9_EPING|nr:hypothetical protein B5807_11703 [Epicoccum nigrum]
MIPQTRLFKGDETQKMWHQNGDVPQSVERCVHDLFVEQAAAQPDAPAICAWDGELTYGELHALSTKLAVHLVGLGVKAESIVPLCFEKSMWTVVAMLAVLKAGGAFVPLDPDHPQIRNKEILQQTAATILLTSARYSTLWENSTYDVVSIDKPTIDELAVKPLEDHRTAEPNNAVYVMFTSGSTGKPKGVVLEHRTVTTNCFGHGKAFGLSPRTRALQFASYTFDVCITEIITTLMFGGCVCIPSESDRRNDLAKAINAMNINWALLTPTTARVLDPSSVFTLETLVLGGEQVVRSDWKRWNGYVQVINTYGPTECSVWCTCYVGVPNSESGLIGKPFASVCWVVDADDHNKLAPTGLVGELLIEGPILARGYLNDAKKTEEAFIKNPTWLTQGVGGYPGRQGRLYKTGDLVQYSSDGNLVYIGRKDGQVKVRGQRLKLGEVEHHLRDFSVWQRQQTQVDEHDRQLKYWVAQLQTSRPAELLCDKPRPATLSGSADVHTLKVDGLLYVKLQDFCNARGVTLFVVLLAAFRATHFRLTGQEDATIGTANANRDRSELKDMVGFFANMQCLRITVGGETFEELVQQVQAVAVASLANQDVPFERIVSKLKKDRDLSRHPLVQLVFAVHSQRDLGKLTLEGVETEGVGDTATSRFDLEFHFFQESNRLRGDVIFSTDLYAPETIDNMLSLFRNVLEACLKEPEAVVASMALVTEADYAQLDRMGLIRVEETGYPRQSSIVDVFRQQASTHPSRIAVKDASAEMSYAQLDAASDVLAQWLRRRSLAPETLIGVFAGRSCQTIVAFLGILKANLAYLPFDVKIPTGRMEAILSSLPGEDQRVVLVGADEQPPDVKLRNVEFVRIAEALDEQANEESGLQEPVAAAARPSATSLAYVMFTSGSTGQPKGVMVEHRGIVRLVRDNNLVQHLPESRVMAHMSSLAFDASTWEIYACLLNGGTLICIDAETVLNPELVLQMFTRHKIRTAAIATALVRQYFAARPAIIALLDMLCVGGEVLLPRDFFALGNLLKHKLVNCYGPTENVVNSTIFHFTKDEKCINGVPIGRALSNSGAYVMDSELRLVPLGVVGELVVTGDGLARGYTDPKRDVGRFVSVTIAGQTVRAYRTGDYVRYRPTDGHLEYFGRMDGQVKIRGQRVELGEIEHVLRSHKCVSDAVIVLQQHEGDEVRLAGFVTVDEGVAAVDEQPDDGDGNNSGGGSGNKDESQHVGTWGEKFSNDIYSLVSNVQKERIGRDFIGWTSMYDGSEIDKAEMNEWLDDTINTITTMLNNGKSGSVLEIGSGTGMILFNLGDGLQSYVGLDPSRKAVEFVAEVAQTMPAMADKIRLHKATAEDVGRLEQPVAAELVVLNSVVQYFPSQEYLFKVIEELLKVAGVQTIFFGDIRSYALHREFLATRALHIAGDKATKADMRRMVSDMERVERELLVDPAFFTALPSRLPELVEHVEILPKKMKATNELSCYRYAAVVHVRSQHGQKQEVQHVGHDEWIDFSERKLDRQSLQQQLTSLSSLPTIAVSNIPYSKTIVSRCLVELLDNADADAGAPDAPGWLTSVYQQAKHQPSLSATDLVELAQESGCRVEISWSRQYSQRGGLDAIFHRYPPRNGENRILFRFPTDHADRPLHGLSSRPLRQQFLKKTQQQLLEMLEAQLPAYMVPQAITVLDAMPVTQNGKVDRKALEQRTQAERSSRTPVQQSLSEAERRMQQLWAQVLGITADSIGLDDSFFRLGGDSIAAMKLVGEARKQGMQLSVADLFRHPKLAALASLDINSSDITAEEEEIAAFSLLGADADATQVRKEVAASCGVDADLVEDVYPCSPLQEGLVSLTAKRAGDYIMQSVLELGSGIDEGVFRAAWEHVIRSTAILRTRVVQHSELGLLQAVVAEDMRWTEAEGLEEYLDKDKSVSMGLGDPLARYAVVKEEQEGGDAKRWFVWTAHHALYDGWSLPRIMDAVAKAYSGGEVEQQKQPSFQSFIKHLAQQDPDEAATYWQAALADCEATLFPVLPSAVQQPVADASIHYQCAPLPKTASDMTTSTLIRAAWAILASRYTGSDDVVFGAVVTGRNAPVAGIEAVVGPTIATVPVRVQVRKDQTAAAFLSSVQQQATEMIPYEQTGLQRIAGMGAGAQHACGFQTLLVVQPANNSLAGDSALGEWRGGLKLQGFTTYGLTVQCMLAAEGAGIAVTASFNERIVERWLVEKMLSQFSYMMQQLARVGPETMLAGIDALTPKDRQELWTCNGEVPAAVERCVHDLFAEQAQARPDAPAICAWDGELTYGELDALSTKLAGHLVELGVKAEDIVPLCFEKSMWTVVAMLAVLKAGGAFVPLDPDHPRSRHEEVLKQTQAGLVLTSAQHVSLWADSALQVVTVSDAFLCQLLPDTGHIQPLSRPGNAAYTIFTSGSTSIPKGVVLEHQAVSTSCLSHGVAFGFTQHTRALQFASYTFDACITEIITTLLFGGSRLLDPASVTTLKNLVLGGEQVRAADWERWVGHVKLTNGYGPAECCVSCAAYSGGKGGFKSGLIGKPIASVSWVVDASNHEQLEPVGAVGELLVEGPILARSYLNDAEKTRAAFISDPTWLVEGGDGCPGRRGRLYKTGDLVRYDADGNLVYMGRKDDQVKVRGQRIELGEVEHHLRACMPEIQQLAVEVVLPTGEGANATLAAFLQLENGLQGTPSTNGLDNTRLLAQVLFLRDVEEEMLRRLPKHMVPTVYFAVGQLPTMTSDKMDRRRLREIGASFSAQQLAELRTASDGAKRAPSTEAERMMQQLWAGVLGVSADSIGLDDSFFRLGGDSIAAMKLVGEARRHGMQLSVADLFRHPRLDQSAAVAVSSSHGSSTAIPRANYQGPVEQSFAQGRLWFLEQLHPGLTWYLMPFAVRIKGPLQLAALNSALLAVEHRHETLRTTFATINGTSVQDVKPFCPRDAKVINVPRNDEQGLASIVQQDQTQPFDLRTEPGWRVSIYRLNENNHVLSIVMHHIVSDGWSADVLMRELGAFYSAAVRGEDPLSQVQPLPVQYRDFSVWQRQQAQVDEYDKQLKYWLAQLQTSRPAELLCDKPRPAALSGSADVRTLKVDGLLYVKLKEFCNARGVTLFVVLLAAFRATHFRLTGQEDATIGTANANRDRSELKDMVGFFVNMQCLRITVGGETFEELVQQVQAVAVASLANQDVPFERIVSKLKKDRDLSRHPLVQLVFAVHSQQDLGKLTLEGVETEGVGDTATSRFDLEFHFFQESNRLRGDVIFSTDLYAPETIDNMLSLFRNVLEACLKEPEAAVASMALVTEADYAQLDRMGLIQVEETGYPRQSSIVDVFRQQASAHPSRIAVKDASAEMSYAQLDAASDVLAQWLRRRSLAPETLVGVFASRSCQTIVAFLGILKANLAYLPFDVKIPAGRMEAILSSLPGEDQRVIFVGADEQPPDVKLRNVEFIRIVEALDEQANEESGLQEPVAAAARPSATSLAYVMFTSGSTGQPKGVMVEHRGIVRLVRDNSLVQRLPTSPIMAHVANLAFDGSTWEIYACLLNGGTLVCIESMVVLDPDAILQHFYMHKVQTAFLTTALFKTYATEVPALLATLDMFCVGGEAMHWQDLSVLHSDIVRKMIHVYGPTENTTFSTIFIQQKDHIYTNGVPIGRALSNSGAYVMDSELQLVPLGVVGELVVTGDGLARGYTDPQRNAGRFVSVTIGGQTVKAYRTGDYVRYRPVDGQLEFFGRMDGQVKIRGQRVELGEIEHVLRNHSSVRDAVTVLHQHDGDEVRLASFVTIDKGAAAVDKQPDDGDGNDSSGGSGGKDESQHVGTWEEKFDNDIYSPVSNVQKERVGRDFIGWTSMYDGSEIDKAEMNEWLDDTLSTMLNGGKPGSVLEIGSGTGMILFNLGDGLQSYVGLDPSRKAVEFVTEAAKTMPAMAGKIRLHKATAEDMSRLEQPVAAELVVLNSVVQYFPSQEYLFKVIEELLRVAGVQTIFFGDIRSYALHREFLAARALHVAGDKATKADIRRIVTDMERVERELLVDPAFFTALPSRLPELVEHVEILPKKMKATNELSCYRYAAVVHVRSQHGQKQEVQHVGHDEWIDFSERKLDRQSLQQQLTSLSSLPTIAVSNIPYSKTIVSRCLVELLDNADADAGAPDAPGWLASVYQRAQHQPSLSATDLVELAQESGCRVEISWNRQYSQRGGLDAIFHRYPLRNGENRILFRFPTDHADRPLHSLSSRPLRQQFLKKTQQQLLEMLEAQLPGYMVPQAITVLDAMPVTQNGKVDRKALEQRIQAKRSSRALVQQSLSEAERTMQQLWAQVLSIAPDSIGLDDSFFRLGGDSIAAMKLVGEARKQGMQLSVADLFRHPKLAALASLDINSSDITAQEEEIAAFSLLGADADATQVRKEVAAGCGVDADLVEDVYPCSPLQEGLVSLTAKRAGDYIMQSVLKLRNDVDEGALRAAWEHVIRSTAILRTRIVQHSELGLLQAVVTEDIEWRQADKLETYLKQDKGASMALGDPLARYAVVKEEQEGGEKKWWFVWTVHHALYDGWSLPRIMDAVEKAYGGTEIQKQPGFQAFIKHLGQQDPDEAAAYWQTALADCEATPFPALPAAVQQPVAEATVHYQCPALPKTASDMTTSTLIRAAWAILASRYTSSDDVVFGAVVTGRNAPVAGIEMIAGPTIATVPVRLRIERDQTVLAFLEGVQKQATEMIPHEQTGLQRIAKMGPDARHACGFQTLLAVQPVDDSFAGGSALGEWRGGSELQGFTTYGLMVQCTLVSEGVGITASFDERIVERWLVERMLGQLGFVMQQLATAEHETTTVGSIDTLTPGDKQQLWEWNAEVPAAVERCVHELFAEQAQARPDAPAICAWDGELTYGELDALSTKLAGHLVELGVKAEDIVPLCFEKSMWTVVAMLAVLKAGGAFVPLDPDHPQNRHEEILRQTKASLVLTSAQHVSLWADLALEVVTVSEAFLRQLLLDTGHIQPSSRPGNAAYIIFTSGSTGMPKGVVLAHNALSTSCLSHAKVLAFTSQTRCLQFAAYTFDACVAETLTTLVCGGVVCVPSEDDRRNNLTSAINNMNVNWMFLTPQVARTISPKEVPSVEALALGGEWVDHTDWARWTGHAKMTTVYGPTECCIFSNALAFPLENKSGNIGKSIASVSWVVDAGNHDQLVPVGSVGELLVEGPILARGYLNDADKTRAAFVEDPAWLLEGGGGCTGRHGRLYKTGDLVCYDPDGNLVYVGRKDDQVKVRGQRVELGEVEHHLRACMPEAKRVAVEVILPTGKGASTMLAAFLQLDDKAQGKPSANGSGESDFLARVVFLREVEEKMLKGLPGHMVPAVYFAVTELPMTVSDKTDRKRLREIGASFSAQQLAELRTASDGAKRVPSTEAERTMQQLWAGVLGVSADSIGLDDSFFRLGGDSIAAMKLVGEARRHGFRLSSAYVFRHPTLTQMSLAGVTSLNGSPQSVAPFSLLLPTIKDGILRQSVLLESSIQQQDVADILPTTHVQRVYINRGIESPREAFNYFFFDIGPELDAQLLRDSCRRLLNRFPILRSQFIFFREKLWQVVLLRPQLPFSRFEINGSLSEATRRICIEDINKTDPLGLPTSFMLYDGVCIPVIFRTLAALYMQESLPIVPSFPTYLAYARTQREASTRYWRELLEGSHITRATARLRPKVGEEPALLNIKVEKVIAAPQLPHNITMASLLSSAWALVLSSITGEEDVVYGHTVAGRNSDIPGIAEMVGPCLNVVPVRVRIQSAETPADLIRSVHEQHASLGEADLAQLDEIIHDCTDWPAGSKFDTMVQHQNIDEHPEVCFAGETTRLQWFDNPFAIAQQLYFFSLPQAGQLKLTVGGNTRLLTVEAAHSILEVLAATVAKLSRNIDGPLSSCRFSFPLCI